MPALRRRGLLPRARKYYHGRRQSGCCKEKKAVKKTKLTTGEKIRNIAIQALDMSAASAAGLAGFTAVMLHAGAGRDLIIHSISAAAGYLVFFISLYSLLSAGHYDYAVSWAWAMLLHAPMVILTLEWYSRHTADRGPVIFLHLLLIYVSSLIPVAVCGRIPSLLIPQAAPKKGCFIAYKKCWSEELNDYVIARLFVPENARRSSSLGTKCRCDRAVVLGFDRIDGTKAEVGTACSIYDGSFVYETGKTVSVRCFDRCRWKECASGIHFFVSRKDAVEYRP